MRDCLQARLVYFVELTAHRYLLQSLVEQREFISEAKHFDTWLQKERAIFKYGLSGFNSEQKPCIYLSFAEERKITERNSGNKQCIP